MGLEQLLGMGASAVPDQMAANLEAWDTLHQNGKIADSMVKANPAMLKEMGFQSPSQFGALSAPDKIAATTGFFKAQGAKEVIARMKDFQSQADRREQDQTDDETAGAFLKNFLTSPAEVPDTNNPAGGTRPATAQERLASAAEKTPGMTGRLMPKVLDSLARWQNVTAKDGRESKLVFDKTSLPGNTVVKTDTGNGFQVVPNERPDRTEMTQYQKAQLVHQARNKYLDAKRQVDSFAAMKDDKFAQSLLPGAQEALQSAQDELESYGIKTTAPAKAAAAKVEDSPASRAALANQIAKENPAWSRKQILDEVANRFAK